MATAPLLWRFHLYYWDWAWGLASRPAAGGVHPDVGVVDRGRPPGARAILAPVPDRAARLVALRAVPRPGPGAPIEGPLLCELGLHAGFLRRSLESDVGGNHLVKNLKALVGLAVFFADDALLRRALRRLRRQLAVQVLPDGGHFERAPAYHCQVLGDLIDVCGLLGAAGPDCPASCPSRSPRCAAGWARC